MLQVKDAVASAIAFVQDLYASVAQEISLEEVELSEDDRYWLVTVGFVRPDLDMVNPIRVLAKGAERVYKVIKVDAHTGEAVSMKIRDITTPA